MLTYLDGIWAAFFGGIYESLKSGKKHERVVARNEKLCHNIA